MKKKRAKKIATWIIVPLMASIFILDMVTVVLANAYYDRFAPVAETFDCKNGDDRIHFLNTGASDAILLETNGHFALIDSGEGNSNPRRKTAYRGYEKDVTDYLKKVAGDENGLVTLDFILGTHYHYDHIGAFHAIITDKDITVLRGYFKPFSEKTDTDYEVNDWKLGETYRGIIDDLTAEGSEIIEKPPSEPFTFGDFTLQFYNTVTGEESYGKGENAASIGIKVTKNGKIAFLAADITAETGLEETLAEQIGDVDLLKIGHHGYYGSSSRPFLRVLKPEIAVVTNRLGKIYPNVKWNLTMCTHTAIYDTVDNNGLVASFTDNGEIILTNAIH